jgi:hypothetical protein
MSNPIDTNGTPDLAPECKKWEARCAELAQERDRLSAELAKVTSERDSYLKTVYYYLRKEATPPDFTREEVFAAVENEQSFADLVDELNKQYGQEK